VVSRFSPTFLPFLGGMSVFLLGMGLVNPLGTAQALSPFGEKAGAAFRIARLLANDECRDRGMAPRRRFRMTRCSRSASCSRHFR